MWNICGEFNFIRKASKLNVLWRGLGTKFLILWGCIVIFLRNVRKSSQKTQIWNYVVSCASNNTFGVFLKSSLHGHNSPWHGSVWRPCLHVCVCKELQIELLLQHILYATCLSDFSRIFPSWKRHQIYLSDAASLGQGKELNVNNILLCIDPSTFLMSKLRNFHLKFPWWCLHYFSLTSAVDHFDNFLTRREEIQL